MIKNAAQIKCKNETCNNIINVPDSIVRPGQPLPAVTCRPCTDAAMQERNILKEREREAAAKKCKHCQSLIIRDVEEKLTSEKESGCSSCINRCCKCSKKDFIDRGAVLRENFYCKSCADEVCQFCGRDPKYTFNGKRVCDTCFHFEGESWEAAEGILPINAPVVQCHYCSEFVSKDDSSRDINDIIACHKCLEENKALLASKTTEPFAISVSSKKYYLDKLKSLAPISVKNLKKSEPEIFEKLKDFIGSIGGADITLDRINSYEKSISKDYQVKYSLYPSFSPQRSLDTDQNQICINVVLPPEVISEMERDGSIILFNYWNEVSRRSKHPYVKNQLGWARIETNDDEKYLLVDEIQSDHKEKNDGDSFGLLKKNKFSDAKARATIINYHDHCDNFDDAIMGAIMQFAKAKGYKKVYYHTLESGIKLKEIEGDPPKELYTSVPIKHKFVPTEDKPFNLEGKFLVREARFKSLLKLCNYYYFLAKKAN